MSPATFPAARRWICRNLLRGGLSPLGILLLLFLATCGCGPEEAPAPARSASRGTVSISYDFGRGPPRQFEKLPWTAGMTVVDLMTVAHDTAAGPSFENRGSGATALVEVIDGVRNGAGQPADRNWMFYVNGKRGEEGAGVTPLKPQDRVLWKYTSEH